MSATQPTPAGQDEAGRPWLRRSIVGAVWVLILVGGLLLMGKWPDAEAWAQVDASRLSQAALVLVPLFGVSILLRGFRWWNMMRQEILLPFRPTVLLYTWVFFVKALTPMRSGEVLRALWVKKYGGSGAFAAGTIVVERVIDLFVLISLAAATMFLEGRSPLSDDVVLLILLAVLILTLSVVVLSQFGRNFEPREVSRGDGLLKWSIFNSLRLLKSSLRAFSLVTDWRCMLGVVAASVVAWLCVGGAYYFFLSQFFPDIAFFVTFLMIVLVNVVGLISTSPAGLGSFEAAGVMALALVGKPVAESLPVVISLHLIILFSVFFWGVVARTALRSSIKGVFRLY